MPWARGFLPAVVLIAAVQAALVAGGGWPAATGEFWGPDSYMRLARTLACDGGAACADGVFGDTNAPFGDVLHWPYLQDRLLLTAATPLAPFLGHHEAVLVAASLLGPLLAVGAVIFLLLAARTLLPRPGLYFAGVLLACQPWVFQAFAAPRADHHALQGLLFLGLLAATIRVLSDPNDRGWARATGLFFGLALWVSTEALVAGLPFLVGLAALWVVRGGREAVRANRDLALTALGVLSIGLLLDGPPGEPLAALYDRFSVVHWVLLALMAAFWWGAEHFGGMPQARARARLALGCAGAAACAGVMAVAFPPFFGGPMVELDPRLASFWLAGTSEFIPVVARGRPLVVSLHLASPLLALPVALACAVRGDRRRRQGWLLLVGASLWFLGLTLFLHGRWALYLHLLVPIPLAWVLGRLVESRALVGHSLVRSAATVAAVGVVAAFPFFFAVPMAHAEARANRTATHTPVPPVPCVASSIVPFLEGLEGRHGAGIILAPAAWGPEIVFRTRHRAVASPYHRNVEGLLDSHAFMSATDGRAARAIAIERGIDWVAMCRDEPWFPALQTSEGTTLHERLSAGQAPSWLRSLSLPDALARSVLVFEVTEATRRMAP